MSDMKLYNILETFDKLESATDKLTPYVAEGSAERIKARVDARKGVEGVGETQTKVQTMGNKVKVTTDGNTTEFDDEETAASFMGAEDDQNQFATESVDDEDEDDDFDAPDDNEPSDADLDKIEYADEIDEDKEEVNEEQLTEFRLADKDESTEFSTFDSENEAHRKRLQRGTPVVLSPEICSEPKGDRKGIFINRSASGHYGTVIRDCDGKTVKVHLSDIVSADITNNSVYESYNIDFDALLLAEAKGGPFPSKSAASKNAKSEIGGGKEGTNFSVKEKDGEWFWDEKLNEDITMTQTSNLESPENDTTTVTAIGPEAGEELAALMANAGLNTGEYAEPVDAGEPADAEPVAPEAEPVAPAEMPMQDMMSMMDAPPVAPVAEDDEDSDLRFNSKGMLVTDLEFMEPEEINKLIKQGYTTVDDDNMGVTELRDYMSQAMEAKGEEDEDGGFAAIHGLDEPHAHDSSDDEFSELNFDEPTDAPAMQDDRLTRLAQALSSIPQRGEKRAAAIEEEGAIQKADTADRISTRVKDRFAKGAERIHTRVAERGAETLEPGEEVVAETGDGATLDNLNPELAQHILNGDDVQEVLTSQEVSEKDKAILNREYDEIAAMNHLHPDDDFEQILDRLHGAIHDKFSQNEATGMSDQGIPTHTPMTRDEAMAHEGPLGELEEVLSKFDPKTLIDWVHNGNDEVDEALYAISAEEMPYGTQKARTGDPSEWLNDRYGEEITHYIEQTHGERLGEDERDIQHANTPAETIQGMAAVLQGGGLNKEKSMYKPAAGGDNPMTEAGAPSSGKHNKRTSPYEPNFVADTDEDECKHCGELFTPDAIAAHEDDCDSTKFVNEHESVDNFLNLYKAFSIRGEKK